MSKSVKYYLLLIVICFITIQTSYAQVDSLQTDTLEIHKTILLDVESTINFVCSSYKSIYLFTKDKFIEVSFMGNIKITDIDVNIDFALCNKKSIIYLEEDNLYVFDINKGIKKLWKEIPKKATTYFVLEQSIYIFEDNYLYTYTLPVIN